MSIGKAGPSSDGFTACHSSHPGGQGCSRSSGCASRSDWLPLNRTYTAKLRGATSEFWFQSLAFYWRTQSCHLKERQGGGCEQNNLYMKPRPQVRGVITCHSGIL